MEPNELNALSALLAEDDFAKGVALGPRKRPRR